ncbi:hypothetical protein B0I37DRAFT_183132 [Chaetomium sp. MPI-CAGE-AT-0009]|nr:hypothetical protein B0I37DRAFT_183132 [Chaetomium sp. MPI-CAGE-AT-0009]
MKQDSILPPSEVLAGQHHLFDPLQEAALEEHLTGHRASLCQQPRSRGPGSWTRWQSLGCGPGPREGSGLRLFVPGHDYAPSWRHPPISLNHLLLSGRTARTGMMLGCLECPVMFAGYQLPGFPRLLRRGGPAGEWPMVMLITILRHTRPIAYEQVGYVVELPAGDKTIDVRRNPTGSPFRVIDRNSMELGRFPTSMIWQ